MSMSQRLGRRSPTRCCDARSGLITIRADPAGTITPIVPAGVGWRIGLLTIVTGRTRRRLISRYDFSAHMTNGNTLRYRKEMLLAGLLAGSLVVCVARAQAGAQDARSAKSQATPAAALAP